MFVDLRGQHVRVSFARSALRTRHSVGGDSRITRARQSRGAGLIGEYLHHPIGGIGTPQAEVDERSHIAASPGNEDDNRPALRGRTQAMTTPREPLRTSPMTSAS